MSLARNKGLLARAAVLGLLVYGSQAASSVIMVVKSSGPSARSFPPGRTLPAVMPVLLRPGDMIVLLDDRGTRTYRGPGSFAAGAGASGGSAFSARVGGGARMRIGALRAEDTPIGPPTLWYVDITKGGHFCFPASDRPRLWRPSAETETILTVTDPAGSSLQVDWRIGQKTAEWPSLANGVREGKYQLTWPGAASPTVVQLYKLDGNPTNLQATAAGLIAKGCQAQLEKLIDATSLSD